MSSAGSRQPKRSTSTYARFDKRVLRPLVESSQDTSGDYANYARDHGFTLSVGRKGQCSDIAVAESFFATIKRELIDTRPWPTRAGLRTAVFDYIEGWYNTRRLHSSLGHLPPTEYENLHHHTTLKAA